jgi:hypothetical protein
MSKRERQAYRQGQKAMAGTILAIMGWTSIAIIALIKAGIYVI